MYLSVLDDFSDYYMWEIQVPSGADASVSYSNGLKFEYSFGAETWAQIWRDFYIHYHFPDKDYFNLKMTYSGNFTMEFAVMDENDTWHYKQFSPTENVNIYLSDLEATDFVYVKKIKIGFLNGSGKVELKSLSYYGAGGDYMIDDFEDANDGDTLLGGACGAWINPSGKGDITSTPTDPYLTLAFTYDASNIDAVWFMDLLSDYNFSAAKCFSFKIKGASGGEKIALKISDGAGNSYVKLLENLSTEWMVVEIPLSELKEYIDPSMVRKIEWGFRGGWTPNVTQDETVMIDDIKFVYDQIDRTIESFNMAPDNTAWEVYYSSGASISVKKTLSGWEVAFDVPSGEWAVMELPIGLNFSEYDGVGFEADFEVPNSFELKLEDADGTVYIGRFGTLSGGCKLSMPFSEFSFFSAGTDDDLNLKCISKVYLTMVKDEAGSGTTLFKQLFLCQESTCKKTSKVFSRVYVGPNPFSPNGDGYRDELRIILESDVECEVKLAVVDGNGILWFHDAFSFCGQKVWIWRGGVKGGSSPLFPGIYFVIIKAKSSKGTETLKIPVAVFP